TASTTESPTKHTSWPASMLVVWKYRNSTPANDSTLVRMAAAIEPGTPQAAAVAWAQAVMAADDLRAVWPATDPTLRLVLAQDWVWNHRHDPAVGHDRDWDAIARSLAAWPPDHPFWDR